MFFVCCAVLILFLHVGGGATCGLGDQPVCGNNNKTYDNLCTLQLNKFFNARLRFAHDGPCKTRTRRDGGHRESHPENGKLVNKILRKREIKKKEACLVRKVHVNDYTFRRNQKI